MMTRKPTSGFSNTGVIVVSGLLIGISAWVGMSRTDALPASLRVENISDTITLMLAPSAEQAFAYGEQRFTGDDAESYDLDTAKYFYTQASDIDPKFPNAYHQRARIEFLRGNYDEALALIEQEIATRGDDAPSAFYVRGLIKGFNGDYAGSAEDFAHYLRLDPSNWAAVNDLAWALLQQDRPQSALARLEAALPVWPNNPWLLNMHAVALFEAGRLDDAAASANAALLAMENTTEQAWLVANPGNDPLVGAEGFNSLRQAIEANIHSIEAKRARREQSVQ